MGLCPFFLHTPCSVSTDGLHLPSASWLYSMLRDD
jgi:hypothetical protein